MTTAHPGHQVWTEIAPELTPSDFRYPYLMSAAFLRRLSKHRRRSAVPFRVVSDHRPLARNQAAGGATGSAHMDDPCAAVDLRVQSSRERYLLLRDFLAGDVEDALRAILDSPDVRLPPGLVARAQAALEGGAIERVGVYPPTAEQRTRWGKNSGSLHVDDSASKPRRVAWVSV